MSEDKKYVVALGKSLTSKREVIAEGEEISPSDFTGDGEAVFKANVERGFIVTEAEYKKMLHYGGIVPDPVGPPPEKKEEPKKVEKKEELPPPPPPAGGAKKKAGK